MPVWVISVLEPRPLGPGAVLGQHGPAPPVRLLEPDDRLRDVLERASAEPDHAVPARVHVDLVRDQHGQVVPPGEPEQVEHLPRQQAHGLVVVQVLLAVERGRRVDHDQGRGTVAEDRVGVRDHHPLLGQVERLEQEELLDERVGLVSGDLPEALGREALGVDVDDRPVRPEGLDRREHGERGLAGRGLAVELGDDPVLVPAPEQPVEGLAPAREAFSAHPSSLPRPARPRRPPPRGRPPAAAGRARAPTSAPARIRVCRYIPSRRAGPASRRWSVSRTRS